jgi:hypothetical protein
MKRIFLFLAPVFLPLSIYCSLYSEIAKIPKWDYIDRDSTVKTKILASQLRSSKDPVETITLKTNLETEILLLQHHIKYLVEVSTDDLIYQQCCLLNDPSHGNIDWEDHIKETREKIDKCHVTYLMLEEFKNTIRQTDSFNEEC